MKISVLPDRTRMQTMKPYLTGGVFKCTVMAVTATRGCERGIFELKSDKDVEEIWSSIHAALVQAVCQFKRIDPSLVIHVTDPNMVISSGEPARSLRQTPPNSFELRGMFRRPR